VAFARVQNTPINAFLEMDFIIDTVVGAAWWYRRRLRTRILKDAMKVQSHEIVISKLGNQGWSSRPL
jgi:hypothetical protein